MRHINAAYNRSERAERRQQRELERQQNLYSKMQEQEKAAYDAKLFENHINLLLSVHKECYAICDWAKIQNAPMPETPKPRSEHETKAQAELDGFKVSLKDKLLGNAETKRNELLKNVDAAKKQDELYNKEQFDDHKKECDDVDRLKEIARGILAGDIKSYIDAIKLAKPFSDISGFGSFINFNIENPALVKVTLNANGESIVPSEIKSITKSGKLSVKPMPKSKFCDIYQDYVCGCVFRISRELFALLPIETVIVTTMGSILNTQTGHLEERPILSVVMPRATIDKLNFETLDPSDALSNFVHNMNFKKGKGFNAVEPVIFPP
jgi:hypothetical protein